MGAFTTNMSIEDIHGLISQWCHNCDYRLDRRKRGALHCYDTVISEAYPRRIGAISQVEWHVTVNSEGSLVDLKIRPNLGLSLLNMTLITVCAGLVFYVFGNSESISKVAFISLMSASALFGVMFLILGMWCSSKQKACENSFWEMLRNKILVRNIEGHWGPVWFEVAVPVFISIIVIAFFVLNSAFLIAFWLAAFIFSIIAVVFLSFSVRDVYSRWKMLTAHTVNRYIKVCFQAMLPLLMVAPFNALLVIGLEKPQLAKENPGEVIRTLAARLDDADMFVRGGSSLEMENLLLFERAVAGMFQVSRGEAVSPETVQKTCTKVSIAVLCGLTILWLQACFSWIGLLRTAKLWGQSLGFLDTPKSITTPALRGGDASAMGILTPVLVVHYLLGSVITFGTAIVSVDAVVYLLTGGVLLCKPLAVLFAWIFTVSSIVLPGTAGRLIAGALLMMMVLPFMLFLVNNIRRFVVFLIPERAKGKRQEEKLLSTMEKDKLVGLCDFIGEVSERSSLRKPIVQLDSHSQLPISIGGRLLTGVSCLTIVPRILSYLDDEELKSAVAHELGHLAQGLRRMEWLKLFSVITMFSNYYLTLCIDTLRHETNADKFAIKTGISPEVLERAIIKTCIFSLTAGNPVSRHTQKESENIRKVTPRLGGIRMVYEFFFGEAILGYTSPVVSYRLSQIMLPDEEDVNIR